MIFAEALTVRGKQIIKFQPMAKRRSRGDVEAPCRTLARLSRVRREEALCATLGLVFEREKRLWPGRAE